MASKKHDAHAHDLGLEHFELVCDEGVSLEKPPAVPDQKVADSLWRTAAVDLGAEPLRVDSPSVPVGPSNVLEALLFVGVGPISNEQVSRLIRGVRPEHVEPLISELNDRYQNEGRPYRIVAADGYRLKLTSQYDRIIDRLYHRRRTIRISPAAVEVLALIAYRQPVNRQTIENLRGADCGGILRQLVRRGLLRIERNGSTSRDVLYHTTERFLEVFSLERLEELPRAEDLETL